MLCARARVLDIHHAPLAIEHILISPAIPRAAAMVDQQIMPAARGEVLRLRIPRERHFGRRAAVHVDDERQRILAAPPSAGGACGWAPQSAPPLPPPPVFTRLGLAPSARATQSDRQPVSSLEYA